MSKVQLEQGEARAVLRAVAGLQGSVQAAEVSLEEASHFFEAYDKMARDLAEKLRTSQAALKRAELMVTLAVGVVREHGTPEVKEAMAAKLRAEVKPVSEYLAAPSEGPGALRNAVTGAERKWKRSVTAEAKMCEERDRDLEVLEEALRRAARATPARGRVAGGDGEEVSPENLSPPPQRTASGAMAVAASAGRVSAPPSPAPASPRAVSPLPPQQRSPGPIRSPAASGLVVVRGATPEAKKEEGQKSEARNDGLIPSPRREGKPASSPKDAAVAPRPASPRKENPPPPASSAATHEQLKESNYDSDLDGTSESETSLLPAVLRQMTATGEAGEKDKDRSSPARPARLEKTRGSIALPRGESLVTWHEGEGRKAEAKAPQEEKKLLKAEESAAAALAGAAKPTAAAAQGGLPRRILLLFRVEGEGEDEQGKEDGEMVISSPVNVSHEAHIGPNNLGEADALFRKEEEKRKEEEMSASKKRMSSPIRLLSKRGKSKAAVRDDDKGDGKAEEDEEESSDDDGFVITGPTEVTHQGHVDTGVKDVAAVADVIDSVVNKERPVDVENVYAEELQFAEEYNPNL